MPDDRRLLVLSAYRARKYAGLSLHERLYGDLHSAGTGNPRQRNSIQWGLRKKPPTKPGMRGGR